MVHFVLLVWGMSSLIITKWPHRTAIASMTISKFTPTAILNIVKRWLIAYDLFQCEYFLTKFENHWEEIEERIFRDFIRSYLEINKEKNTLKNKNENDGEDELKIIEFVGEETNIRHLFPDCIFHIRLSFIIVDHWVPSEHPLVNILLNQWLF